MVQPGVILRVRAPIALSQINPNAYAELRAIDHDIHVRSPANDAVRRYDREMALRWDNADRR